MEGRYLVLIPCFLANIGDMCSFLQGNFWQSYNRQNDSSNTIDTLLANADCTVEQLLDEEKLIDVLKFNNEKLIKL